MNLQQRIDLLSRLGEYILSDTPSWQQAKEKASQENSWFTPAFVDLAATTIANQFLQKDILRQWSSMFINNSGSHSKLVGIVMAGNIPMVGFHDLLSVFIAGHKAGVKLSSKDAVLIRNLVDTMASWDLEVNELVSFSEMLKGCDAYIATGSNNSAGYFEYYFNKYPNIIRRNRSSAAILTGEESREELNLLADDVYVYFGRGCRNVTKLYVPRHYDFIPLLTVFKKYDYLADYNKYKNNYDYNLAIHILNKKLYMSNESILLLEDTSLFSPIAQLNYEYYEDMPGLISSLRQNKDLQCLVGRGLVPFGQSQCPSITDYADGINTLEFLSQIS